MTDALQVETIHVLIVEDSEDDSLLIVQELQRAGFEPIMRRVDGAAALNTALAADWDLVIADYNLPQFSGIEALKMVRRMRDDLPVIIVSGAIGEETAVAAMRAGANDYVMKDKLARLGPAVARELRDAEARRQWRRTERELERTSQELDEAQRELVQSEKLAAVGRFASGIAHEVKNPLGIVLGGVEYLDHALADAAPNVRTSLAKIKEGALRAADIVDRMLGFARPSEPKIEAASPDDLVQDALALFRVGIGALPIRIETSCAAKRVAVNVDRNQFQQVLLNLLVNAVEAMPAGGQITVSTRKRESTPAGFRCIIEVADTGMGIAPAHMARVFEPFFSTKQDRKGTGLGLSIARAIVERHNGQLRIDSEPGKGTRAQVILPAILPAAGRTQA